MEYWEGSDILSVIFDCLEGPVQGGVETRALVLGVGLLGVAKQKLLVIVPSRINFLLKRNDLIVTK